MDPFLFEIRMGFAAMNPARCNVILGDNERLPGDLPRLADACDAAQTCDEATAAAQAFLVASAEWA